MFADRRTGLLALVLLSASSLAAPLPRNAKSNAVSNGLSNATLALVRSTLAANDADTWVAGTETQALLELETPELSVFSPSFLNVTAVVPVSSNAVVAEWWAKRPQGAKELAVVSGGSPADSASLSVAFLVASRTEEDSETRSAYATAVEDQLGYLNTLQRTSDGAISMRSEQLQLWSDYMYMVPPAMAFAGAVNSDSALLKSAVDQCRLYRNYLRDPSSGLWKHIVQGSWQDVGLWATGNAWAAAGMTRVLATLINSPQSASFIEEIEDLRQWTDEIISAAFSKLRRDNLLPNYFNSPSTFSDSASSALLAATSFRLATLGLKQTSTNLANATKIRSAVNSNIDSSSGWLQSVVNPLKFDEQINKSPEGQAFVLLLQAAWIDYQAL